MAGSLACAVERELGVAARVLCPLEAQGELVGAADAFVEGEEGVAEALLGAEVIVADELYRPIVGAGTRLVALPHQALSGRNGWKTAQDPTQIDVRSLA
jgi:hypothetical protein